MSRDAAPDLARKLADPGYTPSVRDVPALVAELARAGAETARSLERALGRAPEPAIRAALDAFAELSAEPRPNDDTRAAATARERLLSLFVRLAAPASAELLYAPLLAALGSTAAQATPRSRRLAIRALGELGDARAEPALLEALGSAPPETRRAIAQALGKIGGAASREALDALDRDDPELARKVQQALVLIDRRASRTTTPIRFDRALQKQSRIALFCRRGLAGVLADELAAFRPELRAPDRVELTHAGSLADLLVARTALEVGLVIPLPNAGAPVAERVAGALTHPETLAQLAAWTDGVPRFRLAWSEGGHHRALSWAVARAVQPHASAIVNDPRGAAWTVRAAPAGGDAIVCLPEIRPDPRFAYRVRDVPAASHPTIAAALARIGGARPDDVVWDPFVGSGLELVERARLGPYRKLIGTDLDARALDAARANLLEARVARAELVQADALDADLGPISLIVTNPPMGRRVARHGALADLLDAFVRRAADRLVPGGRLVWLTPLDRRTERAARAAGLDVELGPFVDLGGFEARIQIFRRRA